MEFDASGYWKQPVRPLGAKEPKVTLDWLYFQSQYQFVDKDYGDIQVKWTSTDLNGFSLFITFKFDLPEEWFKQPNGLVGSISWVDADKVKSRGLWRFTVEHYKASMGWTYITLGTLISVNHSEGEDTAFQYHVKYAASKGRKDAEVQG